MEPQNTNQTTWYVGVLQLMVKISKAKKLVTECTLTSHFSNFLDTQLTEKTFFIPGEDLHVHKNYVRQNYHTPSDD